MSFALWLIVVGLAVPDAGIPAPDAVNAPIDTVKSGTDGSKAEQAGPPPAKGPAPDTKLECSPNPVKIGQALVCTLTIVHPRDVSIAVSAPPGIVAEASAPAEPHLENRLKTLRTFIIRPNSMKRVRVEGLTLIWTEATGGEGRKVIPPQRIPVESVMGDLTEPTFRTFLEPQVDVDSFWDAHGPLPYVITNWPLLIVMMIIVGGGVGLAIGYAVRRWIEANRIDPGPPVDPRPAHIIALAELSALVNEDLPGQGLTETFYVRISEIIRAYLERRFAINGLEMTSEEIRTWIETTDLTAGVRSRFDDFLAETDLVKFADFSTSAEDLERVTVLARDLIDSTRVPDTSTSQNELDESQVSS